MFLAAKVVINPDAANNPLFFIDEMRGNSPATLTKDTIICVPKMFGMK